MMKSNLRASIANCAKGLLAGFALLGLCATNAAEWPERQVTLIVPFAPGGNTDSMARITAARLTESIGRPFIVENKGGAGGTIAAEYVARAKPDGYTLFFGTVTQLATAPFTNKIQYNPKRDFVPIANVGGNPFVIAARKDAPFSTLSELVNYGKANAGKLTVGHAGVGGLTHLSAALFLRRAGIDAVMASYRGAALALTDVLAGHIDFYSGNLSEILPYAKTGELKLIAVSSPRRIDQLPNVPTIAETYPGYVAETWNGILGPAGMPQAAVNQIAAAMTKAYVDPKFIAQLQVIGVTPIPEVKDDFAKRIADDTAKWKPIISDAGIKPE